jgi:hypothetical protein
LKTCRDFSFVTYLGEDAYLGAGRKNAYQALSVPLAKPEKLVATISYEYDKNGNQIKQTVTRGKGKGKGN